MRKIIVTNGLTNDVNVYDIDNDDQYDAYILKTIQYEKDYIPYYISYNFDTMTQLKNKVVSRVKA